MGITNV